MLISPDEINKSISNYGWEYENKKITKSYSFKSYLNGIEFVNKIADLAEKRNHHPSPQQLLDYHMYYLNIE